MDQFKAIGSVRMIGKHAERKKEMGKKINPGRAPLGKKMDQLVVYTSLDYDRNFDDILVRYWWDIGDIWLIYDLNGSYVFVSVRCDLDTVLAKIRDG